MLKSIQTHLLLIEIWTAFKSGGLPPVLVAGREAGSTRAPSSFAPLRCLVSRGAFAAAQSGDLQSADHHSACLLPATPVKMATAPSVVPQRRAGSSA